MCKLVIIIMNYDAVDTYSKPLAEYALLKITRVIMDSDEEATPFSLCRVVSREYHVDQGGIVLGSGLECGIALPLEAGLEEKHLQIKWIPSKYVCTSNVLVIVKWAAYSVCIHNYDRLN